MKTIKILSLASLMTIFSGTALSVDKMSLSEMEGRNENSNLNILQQRAEENGIRQCRKMIDIVSDFWFKDSDHTALTSWNLKNPNEHTYYAQAVSERGNDKVVLTISFAPTGKHPDSCDAHYTAILNTTDSCLVFSNRVYKDWKFTMDMQGIPLFSNAKETISANLIDLPQGGCTVVQSEILYYHPK